MDEHKALLLPDTCRVQGTVLSVHATSWERATTSHGGGTACTHRVMVDVQVDAAFLPNSYTTPKGVRVLPWTNDQGRTRHVEPLEAPMSATENVSKKAHKGSKKGAARG